MDTTESEHLPKMAAPPRPLCQSRPSVFRNRRDGREGEHFQNRSPPRRQAPLEPFRTRSAFTRSAKPRNYCNSAPRPSGPPRSSGPRALGRENITLNKGFRKSAPRARRGQNRKVLHFLTVSGAPPAQSCENMMICNVFRNPEFATLAGLKKKK